jgi:SAM-dependent methyltransferase
MSNSSLLTSAIIGDGSVKSSGSVRSLRLQCPVCSHPFSASATSVSADTVCPECGFVLSEIDGVFRALPSDRKLYFDQFMREYELVRTKEGRGSSSASYYLELPFKDLTGRNSWQWQIRAKTWQHTATHLLPEIEDAYPQGCDVLDLGAGNCWLSYRMALRGHRPVAVDLLDNDADGLGAAPHYFSRLSHSFPRFQAEMDRLPFSPAQFDVVIFNASFHYSVDYERTLSEALRCLRKPGHLIIADSPMYSRDENGKKMVAEKRAMFEQRFGFRSDSIQSHEYLTPSLLDGLKEKLGLEWTMFKPWYGINWALRPAKARLLRRREPAKFYLFWAKVPN